MAPILPEISGALGVGVAMRVWDWVWVWVWGVDDCCASDVVLIEGLEGGGWNQWWVVETMTSLNTSTPVEVRML